MNNAKNEENILRKECLPITLTLFYIYKNNIDSIHTEFLTTQSYKNLLLKIKNKTSSIIDRNYYYLYHFVSMNLLHKK